ncbi:MAG TPA: hypothetical protein VFZ09_37040 [Archangium sp.]|uniref:hypothetical protein n=1 Tax=Archangium sp. TaxID=1872627 RepID=UPI002E2F9BA2|nr:hypothetical protein [Archangium sp.]HEX5751886.1 hypothetical protein [Archangium sp.]
MKRISLGILMIALPGCIHIHRKASVAPHEIAERIQFPEWGKDAATVTGPQLKALQIAMDDFRPTGWGPPKNKDALVHCLQQIENYDAWIKRGERVTFVHFTPKEDERCGLEPSPVDAGASYAISDEGVILRRE